MTIHEASQSIKKRLLIATTLLLFLLVFLLFLGESRVGTVQNLPHFFATVITFRGLLFGVALYGVTYFFGSLASIKMQGDNQETLHLSVKYSVFTALFIAGYFLCSSMFIHHSWNYAALEIWVQLYFFDLFAKSTFAFFLVWSWSLGNWSKNRKEKEKK